jgi:hypothetical protein
MSDYTWGTVNLSPENTILLFNKNSDEPWTHPNFDLSYCDSEILDCPNTFPIEDVND